MHQLCVCIFCAAGVLEEEDDVLINVNIIEAENAARNVNLRKKKADYSPYEDLEVDKVQCVNILMNIHYCLHENKAQVDKNI